MAGNSNFDAGITGNRVGGPGIDASWKKDLADIAASIGQAAKEARNATTGFGDLWKGLKSTIAAASVGASAFGGIGEALQKAAADVAAAATTLAEDAGRAATSVRAGWGRMAQEAAGLGTAAGGTAGRIAELRQGISTLAAAGKGGGGMDLGGVLKKGFEGAKAAALAPLTAVKAVGAAWGAVTSELLGAIGAVRAQVGQFVSAFRPDVMMLFDRTVRDITGAIGENLVPVMQGFNQVAAWVGDQIAGATEVVKPAIEQILASIRPIWEGLGANIERVVTAFRPVVTLLGSTLSQLLDALAPAYSAYYDVLASVAELVAVAMTDALRELQPLLPIVAAGAKVMAEHLGQAARAIRTVTGTVADLLGVARPGAVDNTGKRLGKGATDVTFTSADELWKKAIAAGMMNGRGSEAKDPQTASAGYLAEIRDYSRYIWEFISKTKEAAGGGGAGVAGFGADLSAKLSTTITMLGTVGNQLTLLARLGNMRIN